MLALALIPTSVAFADESDFRRSVAPIFERKCVSCHSDSLAKGKLSLASAKALAKGGESGATVEPGKPDESLLIEKITGKKPEMPKSGEALSAEEIATLRDWISHGAPWPNDLVLQDRKFEGGLWWSLQPLRPVAIPTTQNQQWARSSLDSFILANLEKNHLKPSHEADRRTLIRRVTFDLTGLPPTPEDVDNFLADPSKTAYETVVNRLLASPAYGERWARHWLDLAHYGDTHGYDKDKRRDNAWPYRDYVIDSFNRDTPYARFVQEQLAGDVLFPDDSRGIVATGFIAAGPWDFVGHAELREGTVDKEKTRLIDRDDMLTTTMSTFISMTVHCARCHDHKFDPITQKDYYRLQAVFAGVDRGNRPFDDGPTRNQRTALDTNVANLIKQRGDLISSIKDPKVRSIAEQLITEKPANSPTNGYHSGIEPKPDVTKWVQIDLHQSTEFDAIQLIPARPTDFLDTPGFGFPSHYRLEFSDEPTFLKPTLIANRSEANPGDRSVTIPTVPKTKARYVRVTATKLWNRTNDYVFALGELQVLSHGLNIARNADVTSLDSIESGRWGRKHLVDGFNSRNALTSTDFPSNPNELKASLTPSLGPIEAKKITEGLSQIAREIAKFKQSKRDLPEPKMVFAAVPRKPRPISLLNRGEVEQPREMVGPGSLSCVTGLRSTFEMSDDEGKGRVALAQWITDPKNSLTWRSIVNRIWHYHFGKGLVDTPSDFGRNGSKPSHPELLDWLAIQFRDSGGSLKALHRLIVTSATYRQSSSSRPDAMAIDSDNRLLWRMNRPRLDAEQVRDAVLYISGNLDLKRAGPGFEPFRFKDDHSPIYDHEDIGRALAPDCHRRSIYRFTVRSVPHPFLECMDSADPNINVPVRSTTITALQALALWNDPFMLAQAKTFSERLTEKTSGDRIRQAFRRTLGREPSPEELLKFIDLESKHGLIAVCRLLFNTNEFLFVD
jgi:mono/diheme cytochrome c family protein